MTARPYRSLPRVGEEAEAGGSLAIVLTPVPTAEAALTAARNYLAVEIGMNTPGTREADPDQLTRLDGLMAVASALVEREAPAAKQAAKNEAVVRMAGYLRQSDYGGIRSETIGPKSVEYAMNHAPAFRNSGAKALLAPWKVRRAGAIG